MLITLINNLLILITQNKLNVKPEENDSAAPFRCFSLLSLGISYHQGEMKQSKLSFTGRVQHQKVEHAAYFLMGICGTNVFI